jgi:hypothetical protein
VLFTTWQGGQLAIPVRTTLAKIKTIILGADDTPAMPVMYAPCCQTLISAIKTQSFGSFDQELFF